MTPRQHKERFIRSFPGHKHLRLSDYADHAIDRMVSNLIWQQRVRNKINAENFALREALLVTAVATALEVA